MQFNRVENRSPKKSFSKKWVANSTMALALATALLAGCQTSEEQAVVPEQTNVSTEDVAEDTNEYIGQVVTVRGEPTEQMSEGTFTIVDEQFFGSSDPVLVINASGEPFVFPEEGVDIQVTGEVQNFVLADVEREYNLGLDEEIYIDYENQPALIAQSIAVAPEPGELTNNPEQYYDEPLAVTGEIEEIQGANAFILGEDQLFGDENLLVLHTTAAGTEPVLEDGETVAVTGELRPFVVADLERDYEFNWDTGIREQLEAEYSNRPVLVAEDIYPSAIPEDAQ